MEKMRVVLIVIQYNANVKRSKKKTSKTNIYITQPLNTLFSSHIFSIQN